MGNDSRNSSQLYHLAPEHLCGRSGYRFCCEEGEASRRQLRGPIVRSVPKTVDHFWTVQGNVGAFLHDAAEWQHRLRRPRRELTLTPAAILRVAKRFTKKLGEVVLFSIQLTEHAITLWLVQTQNKTHRIYKSQLQYMHWPISQAAYTRWVLPSEPL